MKQLAVLFILLSFALGSCQDKYPDLDPGIYAEVVTNNGTFVAELYADATPMTVANFVSLAEGTNEMVDSSFANKPYYNGLTFHRVMKDFMIQGGCPLGNGTGNPGYRFADEFVDSLKHDRKGILSMANGGPNTNGSQFFVTLKETPWLDGVHTVFGEVVQGQDVVDAIGLVPVNPADNKPIEEVTILEVNIINKGGIELASFKEEMEKAEKKRQEEQARLAAVAADTRKAMDELEAQAEETPSGLKIYWNQKGKGMKPAEGSQVRMNYAGYFDDGRLFDTTWLEIAEKYDMVDERRAQNNMYGPTLTNYSPDVGLIPGFREGLLMMSVGDKMTLFIPSHLAWGPRGYPPMIPSNADVIFELELVDIAE